MEHGERSSWEKTSSPEGLIPPLRIPGLAEPRDCFLGLLEELVAHTGESDENITNITNCRCKLQMTPCHGMGRDSRTHGRGSPKR